MKWKNVVGIGITFLVFVLLFSLPAFYIQDSGKQEAVKKEAGSLTADSQERAVMAEAPSEDDLSQDKGKDEEVPLIISIILLSAVGTFLSWTVVDKVLRDKSHVELVSFGDERGKKMMDILSNATCRKIVEVLSEEDLTASEIAEKLDMSVQRVHYNLKNLKEAGLVKADHFKYSERGKEMDVYSLAKKYFVIAPEES